MSTWQESLSTTLAKGQRCHILKSANQIFGDSVMLIVARFDPTHVTAPWWSSLNSFQNQEAIENFFSLLLIKKCSVLINCPNFSIQTEATNSSLFLSQLKEKQLSYFAQLSQLNPTCKSGLFLPDGGWLVWTHFCRLKTIQMRSFPWWACKILEGTHQQRGCLARFACN